MSANSFGSRFIVMSFGESHGPALGVLIDGCPAGVAFDEALLLSDLARRRPGGIGTVQADLVSARMEPDRPEVLSGIYQGKTLGTPIAVIVHNEDARSQDYARIENHPRNGHADDLWKSKFGHADPRGGGRASGRETVGRVIAGAIAKMVARREAPGLRVLGFARSIGPFTLQEDEAGALQDRWQSGQGIEEYPARFPSDARAHSVHSLLLQAKERGQSYGGEVEIWMDGVPEALGQPVFHKLKADLASAILGVGATTAVQIGDGLDAANSLGTCFHGQAQSPHYGGIRGGLSTGERIRVRITLKPTSTVLDTARQGRHDPCIVTRAIPVLEAMAWLVLVDHLLWAKTDRIGLGRG